MFKEVRIILANLQGCLLIFHSPFSFILVLIAQLSRNRRDIVGGENPVIHITTYLLSNELLGVSIVFVSLRELRLLLYFLENWENPWIPLFDIVLNPSVVRIDPHVSI